MRWPIKSIIHQMRVLVPLNSQVWSSAVPWTTESVYLLHWPWHLCRDWPSEVSSPWYFVEPVSPMTRVVDLTKRPHMCVSHGHRGRQSSIFSVLFQFVLCVHSASVVTHLWAPLEAKLGKGDMSLGLCRQRVEMQGFELRFECDSLHFEQPHLPHLPSQLPAFAPLPARPFPSSLILATAIYSSPQFL